MKGVPVKRSGWLVHFAPRLFVITPALLGVILGATLCVRALKDRHNPAEKDGFYSPTGYLSRVRGLLKDKKLTLRGDPLRAEFDEPLLEDYDRDFRKLSAIESDRKTLNEDLADRDIARKHDRELPEFSGTLAVAGKTIVVREHLSAIPLPFSQGIVKQTSTKTGSGNAWKLISERGSLTMVASDIQPFREHNLWDPPLSAIAGKMALYARGGAQQKTIEHGRMLELEYLPEGILVEAKNDYIALYLDGEKRLERSLVVKDGAVLGICAEVDAKKNEIAFVCRRADASIQNTRDLLTNDPQALPPPQGSTERFVWEFDRARMSRTEGELQTAQFRQTIEHDLNAAVQRQLEVFVTQRNRSKDVAPENHYQPASVTLLDPASGDVLVAASYPTPAIPAPAGMSYRAKQTRLKNQNFLTHPVGSCGKPFLAAAIVDCYPSLATLKLTKIKQAGHAVQSTLGLSMSPDYNDTSAANYPWEKGSVGFREFFTYSINTYFLDLFFLSLAYSDTGTLKEKDLSSFDPNLLNVQINGKALTQNLDFGEKINRGNVYNLEKHPPVQRLHDVFEVGIHTPLSGDPSEIYDLSPFREALPLYASDRERYLRLGRDGLAPSRVNLKFASMGTLRGDLVSYLLGGASGRWTNIKLAEAMARLISGKKVAACLIRRTDKPIPSTVPDSLGLDEKTVNLMRESLQGATSESGTANDLFPLLKQWKTELAARGVTIKCHSKTGTWHRLDKVGKGEDVNSGTYVFYLSLTRPNGDEIKGIAGVIDIEDRGSSAIAVDFAAKLFAILKESYFQTATPPAPKVQPATIVPSPQRSSQPLKKKTP